MRYPRHGRRGLLPLLIYIGSIAAGAGTAAGAVSPALDAELAGTRDGDRVAVIATLHRQVDGERYEDRPAALLRALRSTAAASQPAVADEVSGPVRHFWLVNALAFSGTAAEIRAVADDPAVEAVDLDREIRVLDTRPIGVHSVPYPDAGDGNWGLASVGAPRAWSRFGARGAGVRVGNIDTGVNAAHPALAGRVVAWRDFVGGGAAPYDDNGHGTHTAGTIAGRAGATAIGVAPEAQLVIAKAMAADGAGSGSALLAAAEWMTDPDGNPATADHPHVINNSWSSSTANDTWFRPMIRRWLELGIVPVFSAGNNGPRERSLGSPASYPEVIAVGALDVDGSIASFSARGPVVWADLDGSGPASGTLLTKPDVVAPGVGITSSVGSGYLSYSGTSMAAPHVAGAAALVRQVAPALPPGQVADIIRASADDLGAPGPDAHAGHGRLNVARALELATGATPATATEQVALGATADAPTVGLVETPPALTAERTVRYRVSLGGGAVLVRSRVDGGDWSGATSRTTLTLTLASGTHTVEVQGLTADGAGSAPVAHTVTVDRTGPRISVTMTRRGAAVLFTARGEDPAGLARRGVTWSFGDGDVATGATVRRAFADRRRRTITVRAVDTLGNRSYRTLRFRPPVAAPVRSLSVRTRVPHAARRLVVRGALTRPARVTLTLRRIEASTAHTGTVASRFTAPRRGRSVARATASAARRFAVALPIASAGPGTYRLQVAVRTGRGATALTNRTIIIR